MPVHRRPYYTDFRHVRVRDATAIITLLQLRMCEAEWKLQGNVIPKVNNSGVMEHLASAAGLLFLLDDALLPALLIELCLLQPLIEALGDSERQLCVKAAAVGGTFEMAIVALCDLMKAI